LALIRRTAYPRFGRNPSARELARLCTPTLRELDLAEKATRGGEGRQLAFLVMLKSFQRLGRFPGPEEVPEAVLPQSHHNNVAVPGVRWLLVVEGDLQEPLRCGPPRLAAVNREDQDGPEVMSSIQRSGGIAREPLNNYLKRDRRC